MKTTITIEAEDTYQAACIVNATEAWITLHDIDQQIRGTLKHRIDELGLTEQACRFLEQLRSDIHDALRKVED